jgi:hypothetical protein
MAVGGRPRLSGPSALPHPLGGLRTVPVAAMVLLAAASGLLPRPQTAQVGRPIRLRRAYPRHRRRARPRQRVRAAASRPSFLSGQTSRPLASGRLDPVVATRMSGTTMALEAVRRRPQRPTTTTPIGTTAAAAHLGSATGRARPRRPPQRCHPCSAAAEEGSDGSTRLTTGTAGVNRTRVKRTGSSATIVSGTARLARRRRRRRSPASRRLRTGDEMEVSLRRRRCSRTDKAACI